MSPFGMLTVGAVLTAVVILLLPSQAMAALGTTATVPQPDLAFEQQLLNTMEPKPKE